MGEYSCELLRKRLLLILLAPFGSVGGAVAVDAARADLRHKEGLSFSFRLRLHPSIEVVQICIDGRIVVPFGINIVRNDVGEPETEIGLELTTRKGAGARLIERTDESKLFFIALFPELAVACALIQNAPNIDGRVIVVK